MDFNALVKALAENPFPALLACALLALVWLFKDARVREAAHAEEIRQAHAAHLATAMQVIPVTTKVVDCVEALERIIDKVGA